MALTINTIQNLKPLPNRGGSKVCYLAGSGVTLDAEQFLSGHIVIGAATDGTRITLPTIASLLTARPELANTNAILVCDVDILTATDATVSISQNTGVSVAGVPNAYLNPSLNATQRTNSARIVLRMATTSTSTAYVLPFSSI